MAGLRAFFIMHGLKTNMLRDERIQMFVKSLGQDYQSRLPQCFPLISLEILSPSRKVFIALYLMAFYSFLRLSNIVSHASQICFDISRHLARTDANFGDSMAVLILNWSKTNPLRNKIQYVTISKITQAFVVPSSCTSRHASHNCGFCKWPFICYM